MARLANSSLAKKKGLQRVRKVACPFLSCINRIILRRVSSTYRDDEKFRPLEVWASGFPDYFTRGYFDSALMIVQIFCHLFSDSADHF